jgi:hypothetical protein
MSAETYSSLDRWSGPIVGLAWLLVLATNVLDNITLASGDYRLILRVVVFLTLLAMVGLLIGVRSKPVSTRLLAWIGWPPAFLPLNDIIQRWT